MQLSKSLPHPDAESAQVGGECFIVGQGQLTTSGKYIAFQREEKNIISVLILQHVMHITNICLRSHFFVFGHQIWIS